MAAVVEYFRIVLGFDKRLEMDEVLSGPEIVEKVYLLDIIQPLGLLAWLVLGFSLLILLVGGRLVSELTLFLPSYPLTDTKL